jgi:hypothetical protein
MRDIDPASGETLLSSPVSFGQRQRRGPGGPRRAPAFPAVAYGHEGGLKPAADSPRFPEYLQWFHYCEGMVMPPSNSIMVHSVLLPPERRSEEALGQAQRLLGRADAPVESALEGREYLIGDFRAADVMLSHALFMANRLGPVSEEMPNVRGYVNRIAERPALQIAINSRPSGRRVYSWPRSRAIDSECCGDDDLAASHP